MPEPKSPALQLEISLDPQRPAGKVMLVNPGKASVRVWCMGNQWGDTALSFDVLQGNRTWRVVRQPQVYTRNVPSTAALAAGAAQEWPFDLRDGQWETGTSIDQLMVPGVQLIAIYDVPRSTDATEHRVWTGQLRSQPVRLDAKTKD